MKQLPTLTFVAALRQATDRVTDYKGRARRSEFWWTWLAVQIVGLVATCLGPMVMYPVSILLNLATIPLYFRRLHDTGHSGWWYGAGIIVTVLMMAVTAAAGLLALLVATGPLQAQEATLLASSAGGGAIVAILVLGLVMLVWGIVMLVFCCMDSKPEPNRWGASPKYVAEEAAQDVDTEA